MEYFRRYASPLGGVTLASDGQALCGLRFDGQAHSFPAPAPGAEREEKDLPVFEETGRWLDVYFSGREPGFTPPLAPGGTPFQRAVWELLLTVPYGQTVAYGALAARLAAQLGLARMSAQAVGGAAGRNPISLIIPCHRVVGSDGSLRGYAGGLWRKRALLALEGAGLRRGE